MSRYVQPEIPLLFPSDDERPPSLINLGIDFGTMFTKVCFRDLGMEESHVITFGGSTTEDAMVPSVVRIEADGKLSLAWGSTQSEGILIRFLKMGLTDSQAVEVTPSKWREVNLRDKKVIRALSSWYLATIVKNARNWMENNQANRLHGRTVHWSANVGVPVEHYDSSSIETFKEVSRVAWAWAWAKDDSMPNDFAGAIARYEKEISTNSEPTDFHVTPEIVAAIQSFVNSREAVPDKYIYYDIGGGTMDGVAFRFLYLGGERRINLLSSQVKSLGISAVSSRISSMHHGNIEASIIHQILEEYSCDEINHMEDKIKESFSKMRLEVQQLVAQVVLGAKQKEGNRDWLEEAFNDRMMRLTLEVIGPSQSDFDPLVIFVGGGGAGSDWYLDSIHSTWKDFQHENCRIPAYQLTELTKPGDLKIKGLGSDSFRRYAIAYGLSFAQGEGPAIGLPSQFEDTQLPTAKPEDGVTPRDKEIA